MRCINNPYTYYFRKVAKPIGALLALLLLSIGIAPALHHHHEHEHSDTSDNTQIIDHVHECALCDYIMHQQTPCSSQTSEVEFQLLSKHLKKSAPQFYTRVQDAEVDIYTNKGPPLA